MISPARICSTGPPRDCTRPWPSVTYRVWPTAWACQAVRAEGVNRTALTRTREGSSPWAMGSMKTSPVNHSAGPLVVGRRGWMGMGVSSVSCRCWRSRRRSPVLGRTATRRPGRGSSRRRAQDLEEAAGGPLALAGQGRGAGADDAGELAQRRDADAAGDRRGRRPGAVHAQQRPHRDPGPALESLGHGVGLAAQAPEGRGRRAAARELDDYDARSGAPLQGGLAPPDPDAGGGTKAQPPAQPPAGLLALAVLPVGAAIAASVRPGPAARRHGRRQPR